MVTVNPEDENALWQASQNENSAPDTVGFLRDAVKQSPTTQPVFFGSDPSNNSLSSNLRNWANVACAVMIGDTNPIDHDVPNFKVDQSAGNAQLTNWLNNNGKEAQDWYNNSLFQKFEATWAGKNPNHAGWSSIITQEWVNDVVVIGVFNNILNVQVLAVMINHYANSRLNDFRQYLENAFKSVATLQLAESSVGDVKFQALAPHSTIPDLVFQMVNNSYLWYPDLSTIMTTIRSTCSASISNVGNSRREWRTDYRAPYPGTVQTWTQHIAIGENAGSFLNNNQESLSGGVYNGGAVTSTSYFDDYYLGKGSCFEAASTTVFVLDENNQPKRKLMTDIREGEVTIGCDGKLGVVSSEVVQNLHKGPLYQFEASTLSGETVQSPIFSEGHPFITAHGGFSAIDPLAANIENHFVRATQLTIGSQLKFVHDITANPGKPVTVTYTTATVKHIEKLPPNKKEGVHLRGLHLREGPRSYHANGFAVAVNYPEITRHRIDHWLKTSHHLPEQERRLLHKFAGNLDKITDSLSLSGSLSDVEGSHHNPKHHHRVHAPLLRSLDSVSGKLFHLRPLDGNPINSNPTSSAFHAALVSPSPSLSCSSSSSSAETIYSRAGVDKRNDILENLGQNKVILHEGKLVVNGRPAIESSFRDDGTFVAQLQQDENVKQPLYFAARLHPHGLGGTAVMGNVQPHEDGGARLAESPEVQTFALRAEDDYITTLKFPNLSDPTKPDVTLQVHTGLEKNATLGFLWYPVPDDASGETRDLIDAVNATFKKGCTIGLKNGQLSIDIDLRQSCSDLGFGQGSIVISADAKSLTGKINQNDVDVDFTGTLINGDVTAHIASFVQAVGATSAPNLPPSQQPPSNLPLLANTTLAARTSMLAATIPLSVEDLLNMTPPAGKSVNELSFAKLENLMKNAISDDQRKLLGLTGPPSLSTAEENVLNMDGMKDFLAGDFFNGYLGQGTVSSDDLTKDFSDVDTPADKLKWYWQGPGALKNGDNITNLGDIANTSDSGKMDTILSKDKHYNQANNALGSLAYIELMPRFQLYLARDSSNPKTPEEWATELYNAASDPNYVNNLAAITSLDTTHSKLNRLSMMLYALDPTKSYASDLTQLVLIQLRVIITENIGYFDPEILNDEKINSDVLGQLRDFLENGKVGSMGHEALEQWAKDYEAASTEIGINNFNEMQNWLLDVSKSGVSFVNNLYKSLKSPYWERLGKWQDNFAKSWPKTSAAFKFASKGMLTLFKGAAMGFAIMSFVGTIQNWDKASLSTKVATIASGLELVFKGISTMPGAFEALGKGINGIRNLGFRNEFDGVFNDLSMADLEMDLWDKEARGIDEELARLPEKENAGLNGVGKVVGEGAERAVEGEAQAVTRWTKMANISGKIGRALGIVAGAGVVVAMGIDLAKNWDTMSTLDKTLDIINIAAMGIGVIAEGMAFAGELGLIKLSEFMAETVIPVVGAVVAVIGLVVALVLIFTHKTPPPPDTPLDTYIKNTIVPFIKTLAQPSTDWLKENDEEKQ